MRGGGSLLAAFILITPREGGGGERIYSFEGCKRNFLSNALDLQGSITLFEGSQSSSSYPSNTSGAFPCRFVHHKLTLIGSRSNKVFCGQRPPKPRHGLPDG